MTMSNAPVRTDAPMPQPDSARRRLARKRRLAKRVDTALVSVCVVAILAAGVLVVVRRNDFTRLTGPRVDPSVYGSALTALSAKGTARSRTVTKQSIEGTGQAQRFETTSETITDYRNNRSRTTSTTPAASSQSGAPTTCESVRDRGRTYFRTSASAARQFGKPWVRGPDPTPPPARSPAPPPEIHRIGSDTISGIRVTHYRMRSALPPSFTPPPGMGPQIQDFWVDAEGVMRRSLIRQSIRMAQVSSSLTSTTDYTDFGTPVQIDVPQERDVAVAATLQDASRACGAT